MKCIKYLKYLKCIKCIKYIKCVKCIEYIKCVKRVKYIKCAKRVKCKGFIRVYYGIYSFHKLIKTIYNCCNLQQHAKKKILDIIINNYYLLIRY